MRKHERRFAECSRRPRGDDIDWADEIRAKAWALHEALAAHDWPTVLALCHPDIQFVSVTRPSRVVDGIDQLRRYLYEDLGRLVMFDPKPQVLETVSPDCVISKVSLRASLPGGGFADSVVWVKWLFEGGLLKREVSGAQRADVLE